MATELGTGCSHGVKWEDECAQCETVWGHSFMNGQQKMLATFYNVNTKDELITAQMLHIEKLQDNYQKAVKGRQDFRNIYRTVAREG